MQWRNDTPVTLMNGCDLWSRWGKILNGVANVTKHDAGQLTIDESFVPPTVSTEAQREMLRSGCGKWLSQALKHSSATEAIDPAMIAAFVIDSFHMVDGPFLPSRGIVISIFTLRRDCFVIGSKGRVQSVVLLVHVVHPCFK
ncbi:hypothetical protein ACIGJK_16465 [Pseudomonas iridis]|uniref:hypothetical protein n=1 Tax=Pseudomonas iridis TaxID=2710587 RepID=UPI0037CB5C9C